MGFWPFGGGKRQRMVGSDDHGRETFIKQAPAEVSAQGEKHGGEKPIPPRISSQQPTDEGRTKRLSKTRTQSYKSLQYSQHARSQTAPVEIVDATRHLSRTNSQYDEKALYKQNPLSQSSLGPENFTVISPPTLHGKRTENDANIPRRKSSKRKAEDFAREREIRAMSSSPIPIPKRPATFYDSGPLQRDSQHFAGPPNRRLERPTSEISLPMPESLPDVSDMLNQNSFKVGILAALSPRPTVRYDANPKNKSGKEPARSNLAIQQAIVENDVSDRKRINELADDLDAGGLRELLERDRRRRERKRDADKAKLQRRLQRKAERQREEEARRVRTEAFVRSSPAPGSGVGEPGLDTSPSQGLPSSPRYPPESVDDEEDPFSDGGPSTVHEKQLIRNPFEDEKDTDALPYQQDSEAEDDQSAEIAIPIRSPQRRVDSDHLKPAEQVSQPTLSPPVSPVHRAIDRSSLSQASFMNREATPDIPERTSLERPPSDQSNQRISSWTTFFKRGSRRKYSRSGQGRVTPSEFSNTSRESVSRRQQQPTAVAPRSFKRSDSATPQRTMSRFREDLPELPISPPDSRVQSPEARSQLKDIAPQSAHPRGVEPSSLNTSSQRDSYGSQLAEQAARVSQSQQQRSLDLGVPSSGTTNMVLSQSLASVDSEGSWLSGKPPKRISGTLSHNLRPSQSSLKTQVQSAEQQENPLGLSQDDFYNRVDPPVQEKRTSNLQFISASKNDRSTSKLGQEQQGEDDNPKVGEVTTSSSKSDEKWHSGAGRQPTLMKYDARAKSSEGLLNDIAQPGPDHTSSSDNNDDQDSDSPSPFADARETPLLRAKSVEYKGHIRHISAGSAKLLDIRRSSVHSDQSRPISAVGARKSELSLHAEDPINQPEGP